MQNIKVQNMTSPSSGREVANQFKIFTKKGVYFQSYDTMIAFKPYQGKIVLDKYSWKYSPTTSKYRAQFLREDTQTTSKKIDAKIYTLKDLNKSK
jgi:hypothetical protein